MYQHDILECPTVPYLRAFAVSTTPGVTQPGGVQPVTLEPPLTGTLTGGGIAWVLTRGGTRTSVAVA